MVMDSKERPKGLGPTGFDPSRMDWHDRSIQPHNLVPVLAEYHAWNNITRELKYQVVWWFNGEWRPYPRTEDKAYVKRWSPLPSDSDGSRDGRDAQRLDGEAATARAEGIAQGGDHG